MNPELSVVPLLMLLLLVESLRWLRRMLLLGVERWLMLLLLQRKTRTRRKRMPKMTWDQVGVEHD